MIISFIFQNTGFFFYLVCWDLLGINKCILMLAYIILNTKQFMAAVSVILVAILIILKIASNHKII